MPARRCGGGAVYFSRCSWIVNASTSDLLRQQYRQEAYRILLYHDHLVDLRRLDKLRPQPVSVRSEIWYELYNNYTVVGFSRCYVTALLGNVRSVLEPQRVVVEDRVWVVRHVTRGTHPGRQGLCRPSTSLFALISVPLSNFNAMKRKSVVSAPNA